MEYLIPILITALLILAYYVYKLWSVVYWLIAHVHVVSKNDEKDPDYTRIKHIFGIKGDGE